MPSFPPPPVDMDWPNIGFKVWPVNGHISCTYDALSPNPSWSAPKFIASPHLSVHGMAPGLNYAVQCFEGIKAFRSPSGDITIFRPDRNAVRMQRSCDFVCIPQIPTDVFLDACNLAVATNAEFVPPANSGQAMYIRPLAFCSSPQLGLTPGSEYTFVVFVMPTGVFHGTHAVDALILEDFDRSAPEGTGSAKLGGNYAPVLRHSSKAASEGYGITLHLDSKTRSEVDEFSTSGFIGVKYDDQTGKMTVVVPNSKNVITSVTSESTIEIAGAMFGYTVEKRRIPYEEIKEFKEVMAAGTAASLVTIRSITMKSREEKFTFLVGEDGGPGPVGRELLRVLKGIQQGLIKDQFGWNFVVKEPPKGFVKQEKDDVNGDLERVATHASAAEIDAINA